MNEIQLLRFKKLTEIYSEIIISVYSQKYDLYDVLCLLFCNILKEAKKEDSMFFSESDIETCRNRQLETIINE